MIMHTKGTGGHCEFSSIELPVDGKSCETPEYINITTIEQHHCTIACVHSKECKATIYDGRHSLCILLSKPCIYMTPRTGHVYQSFQPACTKWLPLNDNDPAYRIFEYGSNPSYIARAFVGNDLIVGKKTNTFYSIYPHGTSTFIDASHYENLVVDPSCSVTWVPFDADSDQPIPDGALTGGFLATTNTPLYVSRLDVNGRIIIGYFNPLNQKAWASFGGIIQTSIFELMAVKST